LESNLSIPLDILDRDIQQDTVFLQESVHLVPRRHAQQSGRLRYAQLSGTNAFQGNRFQRGTVWIAVSWSELAH
jgi:hypothetical protein